MEHIFQRFAERRRPPGSLQIDSHLQASQLCRGVSRVAQSLRFQCIDSVADRARVPWQNAPFGSKPKPPPAGRMPREEEGLQTLRTSMHPRDANPVIGGATRLSGRREDADERR